MVCPDQRSSHGQPQGCPGDALKPLCDKVRRMQKLGINDAQKLAIDFYENLVASYVSPDPIKHDQLDMELGHQEVMAEGAISVLEAQVLPQQFSPDVTADQRFRASVDAHFEYESATFF